PAGIGRRFLGEPDREPLSPSNYFGEYLAGVNAAAAALVALQARDHTGHGQFIDIGVAETLAMMMLGYQLVALYFDRGHTGNRHGTVHPSGAPGALLPCKDGYVFALAADDYQWE